MKIYKCRQSAGKTSKDWNPQRLNARLLNRMKIKSEHLWRHREIGGNDQSPNNGWGNKSDHYIFPFAAPEIVAGATSPAGYSCRQNSPNTVNSTGKFDCEE